MQEKERKEKGIEEILEEIYLGCKEKKKERIKKKKDFSFKFF